MSSPPARRGNARAGSPCRIAVVGGGITGLAAAHRVMELSRERGFRASVRVFEASTRPGGLIRTESRDGYLLEGGPDTLVGAKPAALELCRRLGLSERVTPVRSAGRGVQILFRGRLTALPEGFVMMAPTRAGPLLRSPLFSPRGKLRMLLEPFVPRGRDDDESLGRFVRRRFGDEVFERVAEPVLASLFVADAERLSMRASLPRLVEMERTLGSVTRGLLAAARRRRSAPPGRHEVNYADTVYLSDGLGSLVDALVRRLPEGCVRSGAGIERIARDLATGAWTVHPRGAEPVRADAVVLACPAFAAASLLRGVDAGVAAGLERLSYASCTTVNLAYHEDDLPRPLEGFGFFVPRTEGRPLLACSYASRKFLDRAPRGRILLRAFLGGALHPRLVEREDDELARLAHEQLREILALRGAPALGRVHRFPRAMPQYDVGHTTRMAALLSRLARWRGLVLAGSARGEIGLPDCVRSGERAAAEALRAVARPVTEPRVANLGG